MEHLTYSDADFNAILLKVSWTQKVPRITMPWKVHITWQGKDIPFTHFDHVPIMVLLPKL